MLHAWNPNTYVEGDYHRFEASKFQNDKSTQPDPASRRGSKSRVLACTKSWDRSPTLHEWDEWGKEVLNPSETWGHLQNQTKPERERELQGQGNSLVSRGPAWHAQRSAHSIWHSINPDMVVCACSSNTEEVKAGGSEVEWAKVILSFKMSFSPAYGLIRACFKKGGKTEYSLIDSD